MNSITLTQEKIICHENGLILCDYRGVNSVSFLADIPKSAIVDHIKVDGIFLEDLEVFTDIKKNIEPYEGEYKVVTTVYFLNEVPELYEKLANHQVQEFEVYYHLEAIVTK